MPPAPRPVWLRFGLVVEGHRHLDSHQPPLRQDCPQRIAGRTERAGVVAALGLGDDEQAPDQLHRFPVEHAEVHEPVVF
jgi:hypothetical protein